jgi:DNA-binding SARP family transcriptional activator
MRPAGNGVAAGLAAGFGVVELPSEPPQPAAAAAARSAAAMSAMNHLSIMAVPSGRGSPRRSPPVLAGRWRSAGTPLRARCRVDRAMAEFAVLGPVEARGPAGEARLGTGATVRVVLAILVLRAGRVVSRDALVDALWPDDPPPSARQTVESYVSRLRRALREAGLDGAAIESVGAGYRLAVDGYAVDRNQFAALVASAHGARGRGDAGEAASLFGEALALWRGPAFDGIADRPALSADAAALDQQRILALEAWAEAQLDRGVASEVIARLRADAGHDPRRERLHELLMLALYRCGLRPRRSSTTRRSGAASSTSSAWSPGARCARCKSASCARTLRSTLSRRRRRRTKRPRRTCPRLQVAAPHAIGAWWRPSRARPPSRQPPQGCSSAPPTIAAERLARRRPGRRS